MYLLAVDTKDNNLVIVPKINKDSLLTIGVHCAVLSSMPHNWVGQLVLLRCVKTNIKGF
jgi:hypothetical protein